MLYLNKARKMANKPDAVTIDNPTLIGADSLEGKTIIFPDDIIDTGGTLMKTVDWLNNTHWDHGFGVPSNYFFYFTHAVMSGRAHNEIQDRLSKLNAQEFITTNTRPYITDQRTFRFKKNSTILRVPSLFGDIILKHFKGEDLENIYDFKTKREVMKTMKPLYEIRRSSRHFMEKK
jgi:phosphoribosylpyrophosphate synthetase